jgi:ABC-2 type transport system ATP-binding protein
MRQGAQWRIVNCRVPRGGSPYRCCSAVRNVGVIEARELTKRYQSTVAVDRLSFDVLPGRVTGFLGPNGAGKSTTMRLILGLDAPSGGAVTVNGQTYGAHRFPLYEVGALLESRSTHPARRAYDHVLAVAQSNGIGRNKVNEVFDRVGLSNVKRRRVGGFSLGMTQRLGIAIALLGDPGVLLFDEPVNGLDPEGIAWVRNLLRSLAAEGRTVFVSSHLMSEMALTADYLIVVGRGRLVADGTVDEITARGRSSVRVRTPRPDDLSALLHNAGATISSGDGVLTVTGLGAPQIGDLASAAQIPLHELTPERASLEDAFFALTDDSVDFRAGKGASNGEDRP